jgi:hypothetical protein
VNRAPDATGNLPGRALDRHHLVEAGTDDAVVEPGGNGITKNFIIINRVFSKHKLAFLVTLCAAQIWDNILSHMLNYLLLSFHMCVNRPIRPVSFGKVYFFFLEAFCDISHRLSGITPFGVFSDAFPGLKMWVTFACAMMIRG